MINQYQKKILILAVRAGSIMLKSGAETSRVEDTVIRICKAGKISYIDVYATPNGIFVTLDDGDEKSDVLTYVKRVSSSKTNLEKISRVNSFSREFSTTDLSPDSAMEILTEIENLKEFSLPKRIAGAALATSFFSTLFGGQLCDFVGTFFIGALIYLFSLALIKANLNTFIKDFLCCFMATFIALLVSLTGFVSSPDYIIIGVMMIFVPGVAITNSVRDFLHGDTTSGLTRLAEAFVTAVALATGAGIMLKLWSLIGGVL